MENIEIIQVENPLTKTLEEFVIIDRGNGNFTSILKSEYDKQQAEQSTPSLTDETSTK